MSPNAIDLKLITLKSLWALDRRLMSNQSRCVMQDRPTYFVDVATTTYTPKGLEPVNGMNDLLLVNLSLSK